MSENETPAPFMPFVPPGAAPLQPDGGPIENKPPKPPRRKRVSATKKATLTAARRRGDKHFAEAPIGEGRTMKEAAAPRQPRRKAAPKAKRSAKYDLQTILRVAATLKEADQPVFEKLLGELSALAKSSRERVLKALGEVFG